MKAYIGIDPGKSGGIAIIAEGCQPFAYTMPETERDLWDTVRALKAWADRSPIAAIEVVHAMPGQGVTSMFTFGKGYGSLLMALTAAEIPFRLVQPRAWQKDMGCLTKGDKLVSLKRAQELLPNANWSKTKAFNLAIADALLMAEWLRRQP